VLQRSYLIDLIPAYSRNAGHRVTKAPKLFLTDSALAIAAAREPEATGFHLENLVATDVGVWSDEAPGRATYHWRTQSGQEADFVLELNSRLLPVEVKTTARIGANEARHLTAFLDRYPAAVRGLLLSTDPEIRVVRRRIIAAPWWSVL
jgi:uncharacterized protein